jgi:hypothetical protein
MEDPPISANAKVIVVGAEDDDISARFALSVSMVLPLLSSPIPIA